MPQTEETKRERILKRVLFGFILAAVVMGFFYEPKTLQKSGEELLALDETIDFILAEEQSESIVLYTGYDDGSYVEFKGLSPYIDPRAEVFVIENNKKDDVMQEYYQMETGRLYYKSFLDKYRFTHLIVTPYDALYVDLEHDPDYRLAFANDVYALYERIE